MQETAQYPAVDTSRNAVMARIKKALRERSGRTWSVTCGRGTACGWLTISVPPSKLTADGYISKDDQAQLAALLGLRSVHQQGVSVASSSAHYVEFIDRAEKAADLAATSRPAFASTDGVPFVTSDGRRGAEATSDGTDVK